MGSRNSKREDVKKEVQLNFKPVNTDTPKEQNLEDMKKDIEIKEFFVNAEKKEEDLRHAIQLKEAEVIVLNRRAPLVKQLIKIGDQANEVRSKIPHCAYVYKKNTDDKKKGDQCTEEPTHGKFCHPHHKMELRRIHEEAEKEAKKAAKKDSKRKKDEAEGADNAETEEPKTKKTPKKRKVQKDKEEKGDQALLKRLQNLNAPAADEDNVQVISDDDNDPNYE